MGSIQSPLGVALTPEVLDQGLKQYFLNKKQLTFQLNSPDVLS